MKLNKLIIDNFQSHKHSEIILHKGVNVIVGRSDVGKSAIVRVLRWIFDNKPSGDSVRSNWGGDTKAEAVFEDGTLTRLRSSSFNGYILNDEEFKGFGQSVPKEIADFLNVNEINFQSQFDSPFMLGPEWTPGKIGSFLNKIVDLEITDVAIKNIKSAISTDKNKIALLTEEIKDHEKELKQYEDLDVFESKVLKLERDQDRLSLLEDEVIKLEYEFINPLEMLEDRIDSISHVPNLLDQISQTEKEMEKLKKIEKEVESLKTVIDEIEHYKNIAESLTDVPNLARSIDKAYKDVGTYNRVRETERELIQLIQTYENLQTDIDDLTEQLEDDKKEFHELMPEGECPLCGK